MFKRLVRWFKNRKVAPEEMVTIWGIESAPWGQTTPGFPRGRTVALRQVPRSSLPASSMSEFAVPKPPRKLKQHGLLNDPKSVAARKREWLVRTLPDECTFI